MKEIPAVPVVAWIRARDLDELAVSAISVAEILRGIYLLPAGRRRTHLHENFGHFLAESVPNRIFSFDIAAAETCGQLSAERKKSGFNTDEVDLMIAAITLTHNAKLATRNTRDFEDCGIELINPWLATTGPS
jgi:predicted nucleic acid-binding protein